MFGNRNSGEYNATARQMVGKLSAVESELLQGAKSRVDRFSPAIGALEGSEKLDLAAIEMTYNDIVNGINAAIGKINEAISTLGTFKL